MASDAVWVRQWQAAPCPLPPMYAAQRLTSDDGPERCNTRAAEVTPLRQNAARRSPRSRGITVPWISERRPAATRLHVQPAERRLTHGRHADRTGTPLASRNRSGAGPPARKASAPSPTLPRAGGRARHCANCSSSSSYNSDWSAHFSV